MIQMAKRQSGLLTWVLLLAIGSLSIAGTARAVNPPPSQVYYIPFPENNQLSAFQAIYATSSSPLAEFITFSTTSDKTVIYYDHWEDGYEANITNPQQSTTLVYGDGNPANGFPPGNPGDLIPAGTVFSLRNFVDTSTLQGVLDFDARDKVASYKAISLTKTTYPQNTGSLLAGCYEIYEYGIWGTAYRCPVGTNLATSVDADMFNNTLLSIMAGQKGATVQVDADNNGVFEQTATLAEGGALFVSNVSVGARVSSDFPVQVVMFGGRTYATTYMSRDTSLMPTNRWSSSYYCPVSTPANSAGYTSATAVFLFNPGTNTITVSYDYRSGTNAYTTATTNVPAGATVKTPALLNTNAYHYYTTGASPAPFYAFCAVDGASATVTDNGVWDGGFALIGQPSLTTQILLSLGVGRDPFSATNPNENGNPVYATTVGNGHTPARVYVDYNGDNAGALTDPNGNKYDVHYDARELQQLKLFDPDGDQSGMLVYTLNENVKLAAAWAQDPSVATGAAPGFDVATAIPPLREGSAGKSSTLAVDVNNDGFLGADDTLEYDIRIANTARTPIPGPFTVKDVIPPDTSYVPGTTRYRLTVGGAWTSWTAIPDDGSGTPFPLDGSGYPVPGVLGFGQEVQVVFKAHVDTYPNLDAGRDRILNTGSVEVSPYGTVIPLEWTDPLYGGIGDRIWEDLNGNGVQENGELGLTNVVVYLDLNSNGVWNAGEPKQTTSTNGIYVFTGLLAGTYTVRVDPVSVAALNPGFGPTFDLDGIASSYAANVTLLAAQTRTDADFGFRVGASVGDRVWMDLNGNGTQDSGEPGMTGVRVYIDTDNDNVYDVGETNTITSGDGIYYIGNLNPGTYAVRVDTNTLAAGATQTYDFTAPTTDHEGTAVLLGAEHNPNLDFGYRGSLSIGNLVWYDGDGNGAQASDLTIDVYNGRVDVNNSGAADTSDDGFIGAMRIVDGYVDLNNDGSITAADAGTFQGWPIVAGGVDTDAPLGTINTSDDQTDALRQEYGLPNVRVYVDANENGAFDAATDPSAITDAYGAYTISNLFNGTYTVRVAPATLPNSMAQTFDLTAPTTDHTATVVLSGASRTDVDFGYRDDATLGDRVWNDRDNDGVQDAGEPGLAGIRVFIDANSDGILGVGERYTLTDINGFYLFDNLPAATYRVQVELGTLPIGSTPTYDLDTTNTANYASRVLAVSENATNVDFGYRSTASLGDRVWNDLDGNGVQDAGEPGINNVRIYVDINGNGIFDAATEPSAITSGDGAYTITGLTAGTYSVRIDPTTLPGNRTQTFDLTGALDNLATITLAANQTRTDVDFGYVAPATIGDRVWLDANANGQQDAGEVGLDGVSVTLHNASNGTIVATSLTSGGGAYAFTNLPPGGYYLVFSPLPGYIRALADQGADTSDSDANPGTGRLPNLALVGGITNLTLDAGYVPLGMVGDRIWLDEDGDGIQDAGEDGIANARVELVNAVNTVIATTTTDVNGGYIFTRVAPGSYTVRVVSSSLPTGLAANPTFDEDGVGTPHQSAVTLAARVTHLTADFGYNWAPPGNTDGGSGTGAIGDRLWVDADGDGIQDSGEAGLDGVTVQLYRDADTNGTYETLAATTATGADGHYIFDDLAAGAYTVIVNGGVTPTGYTQTGDADDFGGPAVTPDNRTTTPILLAPGDVFVNADFGYQPTAGTTGSIGDRVWFDTDADGTQDPGEPGLTGVSVALVKDANGNGIWDSGEAIIATAVTDTNGVYLFSGLSASDGAGTDDYLVWVNDTTSLLGDKTATFDLDGAAPVSGVVSGYGISAATDLTNVGTLAHDFGYKGLGQTPGAGLIGDRVWLDADGDGVQDTGEQSLSGVTVDLLAANGTTLLGTTVTDANGNYWFGSLPDATYIVRVVVASLPNGGTGLTNTGDPDGGSASQSTVSISSGNVNLLQDFGYQATVPNRIGGTVWEDRNADGTLTDGSGSTPNETGNGVPGVTVVLRDASGSIVGTTVTDVAGNYSFAGLPDGTYTVDVTDDANRLAGWWHSDGLNAGSDNNSQVDPYTLTVTGGQINTTGDFGYYIDPAALGNFVWNDVNNNGIQDVGETGISNAVVTLTITYPNAFVSILVTVTDTNGFYYFGNLLLDEDLNGSGAGNPTNVVSVGTPAGYGTSPVNQGADPALDSNLHGGATAMVVQGQFNATFDFGFFAHSVIGDRVWVDLDGNGVQNSSEIGMTNVTVRLLSATSNVIATTVTDATGAYLFTNLPPATYLIEFVAPTQHVFTVQDAIIATDLTDSDPDQATGRTAPIVVTAGTTNLTVDAGLFRDVPTAAAVLIRAYATADGVVVEFQSIEEAGNKDMILYLFRDGQWVEVGRKASIGEGNHRYVFHVPALKAGDLCNLMVRDDEGQYHTALGITVGTFTAEAVLMEKNGLWLQWASIPDRTYEIRRTVRLVEPWQVVKTVTAIDFQTRTFVSFEPGQPSGFFKIVMQP